MFEDVESLEKEVQTFRENILASDELITALQALVNQGKEQSALFERASSELVQRIEAQSLNTETQMKKSVSGAIQAISEGNAKQLSVAQQQTESFQKASDELTRKIEAQSMHAEAQMKESVSNAIQVISDGNAKQLSIAQQQTESFQKASENLTVRTNEQLVNLEKTIQKTVTESIKEIKDANNQQITEVSKKLISSEQESIAKIEAAHSVIEKQLYEQNKRLDSIASRLDNLDYTKVVNECQQIRKSVSTKFAILFTGLVISIGIALYSLFIK